MAEIAGRARPGGRWGRILEHRPGSPEPSLSVQVTRTVGARATGGVAKGWRSLPPGSAESRRWSFLGRGPWGSSHLPSSFQHLHGASLLFHSLSPTLHPFFPF